MEKIKRSLRNQRGETIVEVLVAFVLLMLFLALFTASLRFARRASAQAQTTRDNTYFLMETIYPVNHPADDAEKIWTDDGTTYDFSFGHNDQPTFVVKNVQLQTSLAEVKNDKGEVTAAHTFTRYYKSADNYPDDTEEDMTP